MVGTALALAWIVVLLGLARLRYPMAVDQRGPWMVVVALIGISSLAIVLGLAGVFRKPRRYAWIALVAGTVELWTSYAFVLAQLHLAARLHG
jgi:hypothetical protein